MTELRLPWLPDGRLVRIEGRGELFVRQHRHPDPAAPVVLLLHGWTASSDLQFFTAYEALAERYSFVGIDHRGHGRGLRSPDAFTLEDAADDAAAVVRQLGVGPGRRRRLLDGRADRPPPRPAATPTSSPASSSRRRRSSGAARGGSGRCGGCCRSLGSWLRSRGYRRYLNRAVPKLIGAGHPIEPYVPWLVSEMSRNDAFAMVDAGRALSRYDARPWASTLGVPAASLITTQDRLVRPSKQRALAAALGASRRELAADHLATLSHPDEFAALTVELVDLVARQRPSTTGVSSPSPDAA